MEEKIQQNKKYFCKICSNVLKIKNELLFCSVCNIFIGKPETYERSPDLGVLRDYKVYKINHDRNNNDFSVMISVYLFFVVTVGIGILIYVGFNSGFLLGKIICQNIQCV